MQSTKSLKTLTLSHLHSFNLNILLNIKTFLKTIIIFFNFKSNLFSQDYDIGSNIMDNVMRLNVVHCNNPVKSSYRPCKKPTESQLPPTNMPIKNDNEIGSSAGK